MLKSRTIMSTLTDPDDAPGFEAVDRRCSLGGTCRCSPALLSPTACSGRGLVAEVEERGGIDALSSMTMNDVEIGDEDRPEPEAWWIIRAKSVAVAMFVVLSASAAGVAFGQRNRATPADTENVKAFRLKSKLLSEFFGRDIYHEAGVVLPPDHDASQPTPICYNVHGFGGSHRVAWRAGRTLVRQMASGDYPRMIYVYLNAHMPMAHHVFADSVNCGPWGTAFEEELAPGIEAKFGGPGTAAGRFVTGHSSGGWASLWMQITHPDFLGGVWSTAPDSVDFRDFTGIDVYKDANAFTGADGSENQLMRRGERWVRSIRQFVTAEFARKPFGGQFSSFDAVFSPKGDDGRPMPLFDKETGVIDSFVAKSWEKYDMTLVMQRNWKTLGPKLAGKINVFMGTLDTFRLEGALKLFDRDVKKLGSDATIVFAEGRDHGSLFRPHPKLWPDGMMTRIHREMRAKWDKGAKASSPRN